MDARSRAAIHVGTSGWNYPHWRGLFYPETVASDRLLAYYAERFQTVEINNTFYRLPELATFERWGRTVPEGFLFAVKASRFITHMKKLKDPARSVALFFERVAGLEGHLGPILFQLPPRWHFNPERLGRFLEVLPNGHRYAFEFRDVSWFDERCYALLRARNAAFCIYELEGLLSPEIVTADFVYIRLHGPAGAYEGRYDTKDLSAWAGRCLRWAGEGRPVFFYFDNDERAYAAENARELRDLIEGRP